MSERSESVSSVSLYLQYNSVPQWVEVIMLTGDDVGVKRLAASNMRRITFLGFTGACCGVRKLYGRYCTAHHISGILNQLRYSFAIVLSGLTRYFLTEG